MSHVTRKWKIVSHSTCYRQSNQNIIHLIIFWFFAVFFAPQFGEQKLSPDSINPHFMLPKNIFWHPMCGNIQLTFHSKAISCICHMVCCEWNYFDFNLRLMWNNREKKLFLFLDKWNGNWICWKVTNFRLNTERIAVF